MDVFREPSVGENAVTGIILNGLARAARNQMRIGAAGNLDRYQ